MKILQEISAGLKNGDSALVKELVLMALNQHIPAEQILNNGLIQGMDAVGERFKKNEVFIPEVIIASRAMKTGIEVLRPHLSLTKTRLKGRVLMATVKGDLHDIGKRIVCLMLEGAGFEVIDLGIDVPKESLLKAIKTEKPEVVGLSALLTTTMTYMGEVIEAVEAAKLRKKVKIVIGGAPVTGAYAEEIKADGYARDAVLGVALVKSLLSKRKPPKPARFKSF